MDGTKCSACLIGASSNQLILDRRDDVSRGAAGDPFTIDLHSVIQIEVP
jgi:hypothetical protein